MSRFGEPAGFGRYGTLDEGPGGVKPGSVVYVGGPVIGVRR
jgi:hypothetical protein